MWNRSTGSFILIFSLVGLWPGTDQARADVETIRADSLQVLQSARALTLGERAGRPSIATSGRLEIEVIPGAQDNALIRLEDHPLLRQRVDELLARPGNRATVSRLVAAIYRLPGAVSREQVMAFYERGLGRELVARTQREPARTKVATGSDPGDPTTVETPEAAPASGSVVADGGPRLQQWQGGQGFVAISVGADPRRPRDTRVVVLRVEGAPAVTVQRLLGDLTQIVLEVGHTMLPGMPQAVAPQALFTALPVFPGSSPPTMNVELDPAQIQMLVRNVATDSYPPRVRQLITGLLKQARSVSLKLYSLPRGASGKQVAGFYTQVLEKAGARPLILPDLSDPHRPLLIYRLPEDGGLLMVRAYPQMRPSLALGGRLAPSPTDLSLSLLRIEGTAELPSGP